MYHICIIMNFYFHSTFNAVLFNYPQKDIINNFNLGYHALRQTNN